MVKIFMDARPCITESFYFSWGFAVLGILRYNGKLYFQVLICPKSVIIRFSFEIVHYSKFPTQSYAILWS